MCVVLSSKTEEIKITSFLQTPTTKTPPQAKIAMIFRLKKACETKKNVAWIFCDGYLFSDFGIF